MTRSINFRQAAAGEIWPAITGRVGPLIQIAWRWHKCRRAARHLEGFSDGQLKDIGVNRGAIEGAVHGRLRN